MLKGPLLILWLDQRSLQQRGRRIRDPQCVDCLAARGARHRSIPRHDQAEMRAGLDLLTTWVLETKAAANRRVVAVIRQRLAPGEQVARMYQEPGPAWLERQAEVAEDLVTARQARGRHND